MRGFISVVPCTCGDADATMSEVEGGDHDGCLPTPTNDLPDPIQSPTDPSEIPGQVSTVEDESSRGPSVHSQPPPLCRLVTCDAQNQNPGGGEEAEEITAKKIPKEEDDKSKTGKVANRFKLTARVVKRNMALTKSLAQDAERHLKMYTVPSADGKAREIFTFDVQAYFPERQSCSGLSGRVKSILTQIAWSRTDEELEIVRRFVMKLACFSRYSLYVRQELANVLFYDVFERGRVVIRQGDVGYSFYSIVSGSVLVEIQDRDPISGVVRNNIVGELGAGATFGDLALLNDDKRRATIVCKEDCEFLKVDKADFKRILMESCRDSWTHSNEILSVHPLFREWSEEQLRLAVEGSQFVEFTANSVVIKNLSENSDNVFIVTKGKCQVIQKVSLSVSKRGREILSTSRQSTAPLIEDRMASRQDRDDGYTLQRKRHGGKERRDKRCHNKVKKWWLLRTLCPGDYFGVGEGPSESSVVCVDLAECLLVNSVILAKHSQGRYLEGVREELKRVYPSREAAFQSYTESKEWAVYKQRILRETVGNLKSCKELKSRVL